MILDNIHAFLISCVIVIILYIVFEHCRSEYRWRKLKRHVIEAIEELDLWDKVNTIDIKGVEFRAITTFLDEHEYNHCFYEQGGALLLYCLLGEIRTEHGQS